MERERRKGGTHYFGHNHTEFEDPNRMFYFEQDGKLHGHQTKQANQTYLGRHDVIKKFGRKELYRVRGYKQNSKPIQETQQTKGE